MSSCSWASRLSGASSVERSNAASSSANGCEPGTIEANVQSSDPGTAPLRSAGRTPARTTLDFPDPLAPTSVTSRAPAAIRPTTSATSRSRPKKSSASASRKACRPLNGLDRSGDGRGRRRRRRLEPRVVEEDLLLEPAQLRRGLEPELLADAAPEPLERAQRVGLAAGPVQGEHQLTDGPLAERMLLRPAVPARRPARRPARAGGRRRCGARRRRAAAPRAG